MEEEWGILLIDASNDFNQINRTVMNGSQEQASASIASNNMRSWSLLFNVEICLLSA